MWNWHSDILVLSGSLFPNIKTSVTQIIGNTLEPSAEPTRVSDLPHIKISNGNDRNIRHSSRSAIQSYNRAQGKRMP